MDDDQKTQVVRFQDVRQHWHPDTKTWDDPNLVYIGRWNGSNKLPASPFANPFHASKSEPRGITLEKFRRYFTRRPELVERAKRELKGKTLVCWCVAEGQDDPAHPICHGQVLRELIES